jgi:beta-lactamase regulating signal transducer with metallopeptidase domain
VHPLLGLSSLLLVLLASAAALAGLRRLDAWSHRRDLQFLVLAAPIVSLALAIGSLHHFAGRTCFLGAPPWDYRLGVALPLWMGLLALGGVLAGVARFVLVQALLSRRGAPAGPELQVRCDALAGRLGVPRVRLRLCRYERPLALTYGLVRPAILLSSWMVRRLDAAELDAVLAHELGHVSRRDYLVVGIATILRDAFFYLPTSWAAYRQLQREKEIACDDLAAGTTRRPLALASALAKVWGHALGAPAPVLAQPLTEAGEAIEERITRLLSTPASRNPAPRGRLVALGFGVAALVALMLVQGANLAVFLAPMGCGPASPLERLG